MRVDQAAAAIAVQCSQQIRQILDPALGVLDPSSDEELEYTEDNLVSLNQNGAANGKGDCELSMEGKANIPLLLTMCIGLFARNLFV